MCWKVTWNGSRITLDDKLTRDFKAGGGTTIVPTTKGDSSLAIMGISLPGSKGQALGIIVAMLALAGAGGALWWSSASRNGGSPVNRLRFGGQIIEARLVQPGEQEGAVVLVESLADLARSAKMAGLPICHDRDANVFFFLDRDVLYAFREEATKPTPLRRERPGSDSSAAA